MGEPLDPGHFHLGTETYNYYKVTEYGFTNIGDGALGPVLFLCLGKGEGSGEINGAVESVDGLPSGPDKIHDLQHLVRGELICFTDVNTFTESCKRVSRKA